MSDSLDQGMFNYLISFLLRKIVVPTDYHNQVKAVKEIQQDDVSGLVDSLTDFAVQSASVDFDIETDSEEFTSILRLWLNEKINVDFNGKIPVGINALAEEYYKERWKGSSFPVLKIDKWSPVKGIIVPTKMYFVDGGSIYSKDIDEKDDNLKIINYDYYLGSKFDTSHKLGDNCIFAKCYGRWYEEYPIPYSIKRGIYHNWKIIQAIKKDQDKILAQIIPYLLRIIKGTPETLEQGKTYSQPELQAIVEEFQALYNEIKSMKVGDKQVKTPVRVTMFDEEIKHLIPDISAMFDAKLFTVAERAILSGLGFIDIAEAVSSSRKESILNPKAFITETKSGVKDFKNHIIKMLVLRIKEKNKNRKKYINSPFYITHSPVKTFMTDDFKNQLRLQWERGQLSNETYCSLVGEVEYRTEVHRREKEAKRGEEYTMYPHLTRNAEDKGIDIVGEEPIKKDTDKNGKPIPTDKTDDKEKYNVSSVEEEVNLEGAPYPSIKSLPDGVKKKLSLEQQRTWMKIWNSAYKFYLKKFGDAKKAESLAFQTAWSKIKTKK